MTLSSLLLRGVLPGAVLSMTALAGCAEETAAGVTSSLVDDLASPTLDPSAPDLPDCWWASDPADCDLGCWQVGGESRRSFERLQRTLRRTGTLVAPSSRVTRSRRTGPGDLTDSDDCPTPNGVVPCPHCSRWPSNPAYGLFGVYDTPDAYTGTVVAITDGYGAFAIRDLEDIAVPQPTTTSPSGMPVRYVAVDLEGGNLLGGDGWVPLGDTVYLQFTIEGGEAPVPSPYWVACPVDGSDCEVVYF